MNPVLQPEGRIGLDDEWQWALDGVALKSRTYLEIQIGGHWILGALFEHERTMYWSSAYEGVSMPLNFFMKARWPTKD